jgi:hypothetical protein
MISLALCLNQERWSTQCRSWSTGVWTLSPGTNKKKQQQQRAARGKPMKLPAKLVSLLVITAMATPAHADVREAAFASTAGNGEVNTSVFAGAAYRVDFRRDGSPRARAALNFSGMTMTADAAQLRLSRGSRSPAARRASRRCTLLDRMSGNSRGLRISAAARPR